MPFRPPHPRYRWYQIEADYTVANGRERLKRGQCRQFNNGKSRHTSYFVTVFTQLDNFANMLKITKEYR